jgi:1-acyl-sn-glycerol-3-phosphate acyltransferase
VACSRRVYYLARVGLARSRILAAAMRLFDTTLIDNEGLGRAGLQAIEKVLQSGKVVLVFPEGERCWDGKLQALKPGITLLIRRVRNVRVVPVGLAGAFELWPRDHQFPALSPLLFVRGKKRVAVHIGRALSGEKLAAMPREKMLEFLRARIQECFDRAEEMAAV